MEYLISTVSIFLRVIKYTNTKNKNGLLQNKHVGSFDNAAFKKQKSASFGNHKRSCQLVGVRKYIYAEREKLEKYRKENVRF